ncbi:MAG: hypothetical protein H6729_11300 [Deltaproteobacteria bacterium]|nr:hypothetical protein [Deltaproteobacteria bacterium]
MPLEFAAENWDYSGVSRFGAETPTLPGHRPLRAPRTLLALWMIGFPASVGCVSYTSGLGFRARQAVLKGDVQAFPELMEEAAHTDPVGPLDNPTKTVLTHFLDLADRPGFFDLVEDWLAKGWVSDDMTCAIHRAHFRKAIEIDPVSAQRSAETCVARARAASEDPERSWELKVCLQEAPFLVATSTLALTRYIKLAASPTEPLRFRAALIEGMTRVDLTLPTRLRDNTPTMSPEESVAQARQAVAKQTKRIDWVLAELRPYLDTATLAAATARGVLEVENVSVTVGESYVGRFALSADPLEHDLAWAWVRAMKNKKRIDRIAGLGLWSRRREKKSDVYWYICARPPEVERGGSLGAIRRVDAITVRVPRPVKDLEALRIKACVEQKGSKSSKSAEPYPSILGPLPLETTARGALAQNISSPTPNADDAAGPTNAADPTNAATPAESAESTASPRIIVRLKRRVLE